MYSVRSPTDYPRQAAARTALAAPATPPRSAAPRASSETHPCACQPARVSAHIPSPGPICSTRIVRACGVVHAGKHRAAPDGAIGRRPVLATRPSALVVACCCCRHCKHPPQRRFGAGRRAQSLQLGAVAEPRRQRLDLRVETTPEQGKSRVCASGTAERACAVHGEQCVRYCSERMGGAERAGGINPG